MEWFLPGEHAGGPVWTVRGLITHLGSMFDFAVVCRDRDVGSTHPYESIPADRWVEIDGQRRFYLSARSERSLGLLGVLRSTNHDVLFINTLFSVAFCLIPLLARRAGVLPRRRVLLAPRGQLDPGALVFSRRRKRLFLAFLKVTAALRDIEWAASTAGEAAQIRSVAGPDAVVHVMPNLRVADGAATPDEPHEAGVLRICFLSRISPKKNLLEALRVLERVRASVQFDIFGPKEDMTYWRACERAIAALPPNVPARWMGVVAHDEVPKVLSRYDLFVLPTLGENFGHAVVEALAAGCPVLVSDRTPWRGLGEHGAGWDLPLGDAAHWAAAIDQLAAETAPVRRARRESARRFGALIGQSPDAIQANDQVLRGSARDPGS